MRRAGLVTLICLAASIVAGCGGDLGALGSLVPTGAPGSETTKPTRPATPTLEPTPAIIFACDLLSVADVEALSPFETPLVAGDEEDVTGCWYHPTIDPPAPRAPGIILQLWDYVTPGAAIDGVRSMRQNAEYGGQNTVKTLAGLGDEAYSYGELFPSGREDSIYVFAAMGRYNGLVHLSGEYKDNRGPDVGYAPKESAGAKILELAFSRLP
jgi:hypothetical protein